MKFLKITSDKHNTLNTIEMNNNLTENEKLQFYYKQLNCKYIDMLELKINNTYYNIIFDDEGKLKFNNISSLAFMKKNKIIDFVVGDIIFCKVDDEGETIGLEESDLVNLIEYFTICKKILDYKNQKLTFTIEF